MSTAKIRIFLKYMSCKQPFLFFLNNVFPIYSYCSVLFQHQDVRYKRRHTKPFRWQVQKTKVNPFFNVEHLTPENKDYLQELAVSKYAQVVNSPLKDAPWERKPYTDLYVYYGLIVKKLHVMVFTISANTIVCVSTFFFLIALLSHKTGVT